MKLDWFRSGHVDEFADSLVAELQKRFPPQGLKQKAPKRQHEHLQKTHRAIFARVEEFARANDLNLYRKARLANRIRWSLSELGYEQPFVEAFTHELAAVVALAKGRSPR